MAISRVTTWSAGQILTAAALNAEFDNIINNALSLVSPWTADMAAGGFRLTGLALGTAGSPAWQFTGDTNTGGFSPGADRLTLVTAGVARMEIAAAGAVFINATSNVGMTTGLTIQQGGADDEILTLKSTDVAHGMTGAGGAEADTYGTTGKIGAVAGGWAINGFSSGTNGLSLLGSHTTDNAVRSTAATGALYVSGRLRSGTGVTTLGADTNVICFASNTTVRHILDSDGDSHQDVGTAWTNFDDEDDVRLLNLLSAHVTRKEDPLRASFGYWLAQERHILEEMKLVSFNDGPKDDGHAFMNMSRLTMLHTGAIRQLGAKLSRCERALAGAGIALAD